VIFLIVVMALAVLALFTVLVKKESSNKKALENCEALLATQEESIRRERGNYHALEVGMDEQQENYESIILSLQDQVNGYRKKLVRAQAEVEKHNIDCLPNITDVRTLNLG